MYYCEACRAKKDWPAAMVTSIGRCEVCEVVMSKRDKRIIAKAERMIALADRKIPLEETTEAELIWLFNFIVNGVHMPDPDGPWIP